MQPTRRTALLEWPVSWKDPGLLQWIEGSPFGGLLFSADPPAGIAEAARGRCEILVKPAWRKHAEIDWSKPGDPILIGDGVWPAMGASGATDSTEAGPTGLPWLEANGWLIRMARDLAPAAAVWIRSDLPEDADRADASLFAFAQCEARAHGAIRPLTVPARIAAGLASGAPHAAAWWRRLCAVESWWQERAAWQSWPTAARLLAVSDFAGPNQYPASEFLNLAARRNLAWRAALPQSLNDEALRGISAVVYIDQLPLKGALLERLERFVRQGGLLVCLDSVRGALRGLEPGGGTHPRFQLFRSGNGRVAASRSDWEDPYLMAQDVHLLMSRRQDIVRLFNPGSILCWPVISPDRGRLLVHLLNYSRHGAAHDVVVQTWAPVKSAAAEQPGEERRAARVRPEAGGWEIDVEPFDIYCALELEGNWDAAG